MSYINKVISGKCPNCGKEKVFYDKGNPITFKLPKMSQSCGHCNYNFHRETGFYFGAMYMSYALTVGEMIAVMVSRYLLNELFGTEISMLHAFIAIVIILFVLWTFNYRVSRIMWLNMFYKKE